ncbi:MAG: site-2 protease family protein [Rhodobacteraceae bacterium]|nr:site-2 protease family protein [Paracoccaceae bacterium]
MFANAVRLFDIMGFEIKVDPSWLIIAGLIVWSLSTAWFPMDVPGLTQATYVTASVIAMLGLFAGLILHELSHSLMARRFNVRVGGITLFIFGGVAELDNEPESARSEFWIAIAGPAMSFALAALFWVITGSASQLGAGDLTVSVLSYLSTINLVLAIFNLVPAFPLDGGRILRSALWHRKGDVVEATRIASGAGTVFGYALIAMGLLSLFSGGSVGGIWQILIGTFVVSASRSTYRQVLFNASLKGLVVADVMTRHPVTVAPDMTLDRVVEEVMMRQGLSFLPVIAHGKVLGHVESAAIRTVEREKWPDLSAEDVMAPASEATVVDPGLSTIKLLERMGQAQRRKFIVARNGELLGVVSLSDMLGHIEVMQLLGQQVR